MHFSKALNKVSIFRVIIIGLGLLLTVASRLVVTGQQLELIEPWQARIVYTEDLGLGQPTGLAYSPLSGTLLVPTAQEATSRSGLEIESISLAEELVATRSLANVAAHTSNLAFDAASGRLYLIDGQKSELISLQARQSGSLSATAERGDISQFQLQNPIGMAFDPNTGVLFVLDSGPQRLVRVRPEGPQGLTGVTTLQRGQVSQVRLDELDGIEFNGVALHPVTGHLFLISSNEQKLYELSQAGELIAAYDLASIGLHNPQGMVFAPSGDTTDAPSLVNLYVADEVKGASGSIVELNLVPTVQIVTDITATLVNTIDTSMFSPPSPDPAGIVFYGVTNNLLISDSEVDEMPLYAGANLFESTLTGSLVYTGTTLAGTWTPHTNEPTGITYNPANGHIFVSDDDRNEVYEVTDLGADGKYGTPDDTITSFDTLVFGSNDAEGVAYGDGKIFVIDGVGREVYQVDPGPDGLFNGVGVDDIVSSFDVAQISMGLQNPEGIEYNEESGTLFIVDQTDVILETTTDGVLLRAIDISAANSVNSGGVAYGPSSANPSIHSFYIADRGLDNNPYPEENDGKVYEMSADLPPVVVFSSAAYSVTEDAGTATITATLFYSPSETVTVDYATSNGTAAAGSDYTSANGTLTFLPGETTQSFTVTILEDVLHEANETVNLTLSNVSGGSTVLGATVNVPLTILDNDDPPTVQLSSATYSVNENGGTAPITVTLSAVSGVTVTVDYATSNGTATAGADYTATSGTLSFAPGETSQTFSIPILEDVLDENDETVNIALSNANNATPVTPTNAVLTIIDNDPLPTVQLSSANLSVSEGGSMATITVTLSAVSGRAVMVNYATSNGTATAGADYTATSGTLTFNAGQTSKTFSIPILEDALDEDDETLSITLSSPSNATLGSITNATLTIVDNDPLPNVQFSGMEFTVAENGTTATVTVFLNPASGRTVSVDYATSDGTATAGVDYTSASGTLTFLPGQTSKTFNISILDDALNEGSETVALSLSSPSNSNLGTPSDATLIIIDNDGAPLLQFSQGGYIVDEGAGSAPITVTLSAVSGLTVTVDYATSDDTATAGADYTATSGTLSFAPGETSQTFNVPILEDSLYEGLETANLALSNANNAMLGSPANAVLNIADNDSLSSVQFSDMDFSVAEMDSTATITVSLNHASGITVTVDYATSDGTATAGSDYTSASGTLSFAPGETSQTFNVSILDDMLDETDETVALSLSNLVNSTQGTPTNATLTIVDDDGPPMVQFGQSDYSVAENIGSAPITVTLSAASGVTVTVDYSTSDDTAVAGADYTATSGTLIFAPGETSQAFSVPVINDAMYEMLETANLALSNANNATVGTPAEATLSIVDNDALPAVMFSATDFSVAENGNMATITVFLSPASGITATVDYATSNGTATAGVDYTATSGTLTFAPGETSQTFSVDLINDALVEPDETVNLTLSNPNNATLGTPDSAVLTIVDNDQPQPTTVSFSSSTYTVAEDGGSAIINVTLNSASSQSVTVDYATSDGTATAGVDYTATSGTLTFAPGETSQSFSVPILNDTLSEGSETVNLTLSNPSNATLGTPATATLNITDSNGQPSIFLPLVLSD